MVLTTEYMKSQDPEALRAVWQALGLLKQDDRFHEALDNPEAQKALKHWTGEQRLPASETEDWEHNPRIMSIMNSLKQLQHACRFAGMKVPLDSVINRSDSISFPDGTELVEGKLRRAKKKTKKEEGELSEAEAKALAKLEEEEAQAEEKAKEEELQREEEAVADRKHAVVKKQVAWQFAALVIAVVVARLVLVISPGDMETDMLAAMEAKTAATAESTTRTTEQSGHELEPEL